MSDFTQPKSILPESIIGEGEGGSPKVDEGKIEDRTTLVTQTKLVEGYDDLFDVLMEAYDRASAGKGRRHVIKNEPFNEQWILRGSRTFGPGSLNYQIGKKNEELVRMDTPAKVKELLDIIVYAAAEIILLREKE